MWPNQLKSYIESVTHYSAKLAHSKVDIQKRVYFVFILSHIIGTEIQKDFSAAFLKLISSYSLAKDSHIHLNIAGILILKQRSENLVTF